MPFFGNLAFVCKPSKPFNQFSTLPRLAWQHGREVGQHVDKQVKIERRRRRRVATAISGRIVFPGVDAECWINQMSATSALVEVIPLPALNTPVALDVPGIGFSRGVTVRHTGRHVCIRLEPSLRKEQAMDDRLSDLPSKRAHGDSDV